jgi:outer membrane immunogenic protein
MKKVLLAGTTIIATFATAAAFAADLSPSVPVYKTAPVPPPPVLTWTGCFIGANLGWARSEARFEGDGSISSDSFAAGGQIGCDYQFASNWVVGIQGLIDAADITRGRQSVLFPGEEFHYKTQWFATITGRIGFLVTPTFLIYGRGGWGFVDQRLTATGSVSDSSTRSFSGPDAGAGFEWMFARNWTLWAEWDHIFGSDKTLVFTPTSTITASDRVRREFDKALVGLNWRFGGYSP